MMTTIRRWLGRKNQLAIDQVADQMAQISTLSQQALDETKATGAATRDVRSTMRAIRDDVTVLRRIAETGNIEVDLTTGRVRPERTRRDES